jgi:hypothetical protein
MIKPILFVGFVQRVFNRFDHGHTEPKLSQLDQIKPNWSRFSTLRSIWSDQTEPNQTHFDFE